MWCVIGIYIYICRGRLTMKTIMMSCVDAADARRVINRRQKEHIILWFMMFTSLRFMVTRSRFRHNLHIIIILEIFIKVGIIIWIFWVFWDENYIFKAFCFCWVFDDYEFLGVIASNATLVRKYVYMSEIALPVYIQRESIN